MEKRLCDIVDLIANNEQCALLKVKEGSELDLIKMGCFDGDETMFRVKKDSTHENKFAVSIFYENRRPFSMTFGSSADIVNCVHAAARDTVRECVSLDFGIFIGNGYLEQADLLTAATLGLRTLDSPRDTCFRLNSDSRENTQIIVNGSEIARVPAGTEAAWLEKRGYRFDELYEMKGELRGEIVRVQAQELASDEHRHETQDHVEEKQPSTHNARDLSINRASDVFASADKQAIDSLLKEHVSSDGKTIPLEVDHEEKIDPLLTTLYENAETGKDSLLAAFQEAVRDRWETAIGSAIDGVVVDAGISTQDEERYLDAIEYVDKNYSFEPNFDHYLDQEICVNVVLGTNKEMNVDFSSIPELCSQLKWGEDIDVADLDFDNGLGWLLELQGNTPEDLYACMRDRMSNEVSNPQSVEKHGVFLTTLCEEMVDFSDNMGTVTALCSMSVRDYLELCDPKTVLNLPRRPETGLFSPWEGAGSRLDIVLPDGLHIPHDMRFDMQIEGADCGTYTVNQVYGLGPEAWCPIESVTRDKASVLSKAKEWSVCEDSALDDAVSTAKERAKEKNTNRTSRRPSASVKRADMARE